MALDARWAAQWRKVLAAEVQAATSRADAQPGLVGGLLRRWLWGRGAEGTAGRSSSAVRQLAEVPDGWSGPGPVAVTATHLVLGEGGARRRASLHTVEAVEHEGDAVWVRRRRAHDWVVRYADAAEAARLAEALGRVTDA